MRILRVAATGARKRAAPVFAMLVLWGIAMGIGLTPSPAMAVPLAPGEDTFLPPFGSPVPIGRSVAPPVTPTSVQLGTRLQLFGGTQDLLNNTTGLPGPDTIPDGQFTVGSSGSSGSIMGILTQEVFDNTSSCCGTTPTITGVAFAWTFSMISGGTTSIAVVEATDFTSFLTDVDYLTTHTITDGTTTTPYTTNNAPTGISRTADGARVGWNWILSPIGGLGAGDTAILYAGTNAASFDTQGITFIINGGTFVFDGTLQPVDVPEPGSLFLLGSSLTGLGLWGWMQRKRTQVRVGAFRPSPK